MNDLTNTAIIEAIEGLFPVTKEVIREDYPPTLEDDPPEYGDRHDFEDVEIVDAEIDMLGEKPEMTYASGSKVSVSKGNQYYLLREKRLEKVQENYTEEHHDLHDGRSSGAGETILEACHRSGIVPSFIIEVERGVNGRHNTSGRKMTVHRLSTENREEVERSMQVMEEAAKNALTEEKA